MNQEERLDYLVEKFKEDSVRYKDMEVSRDPEEKRAVLRSLMNIRMPGEMEEEILRVQDDYLQERAREKGIVTLAEIRTIAETQNSKHRHRDKLSVWQGDITRLEVGAIVNAANSQMLGCFVPMHTCIDNCIHTFAGVELRSACNRYMNHMRIRYGRDYEEPTGEAFLTEGYNLPAENVIHTVGPIVEGRLKDRHRNDLKKCYENILECCVKHGIRSVAFCCISTGVFHFPNDEAARIAADTVSEYLDVKEDAFDRVIFNVFKDFDKEIYESLLR
ncbi:MAG: protein-ADP-ribose hydrolase [Eubacteriales bacterium]|nr:protein-ADP-ribose hydrolase [Eubacteriales bacterium]